MRKNKEGFSAVELLIAMIVALVFLLSGYQVYQFVVKTSGAARLEASANSMAQTYLESYSASATNPCTEQNFSSTSVTLDNGSQASVSGSISCNTINTAGLVAKYYNNTSLLEPYALQRIESNVNHNWGNNSPNSAVSTDGFSVNWSGDITPTQTGTYTFYGTSDDGETLSVGGTKIIDKWVDQSATTWSGTISLTAGQPVSISYSMYDGGGGASAVLEWTTPDGKRSVIPASVLSHKKTVSKVSATVKYDSSKKSAYATTMADSNTCQSGFIKVPGSKTYGTSDFCVMKYEAKIYGNDNGNQTYSQSNIPSSRANGTPYMNITQTDAIAQAKKTVDAQGNYVNGAHLITEAEWMTIAQNVLSQDSNWSSGTVGNGFIYNGHANNNPGSALAADSNDSNGNYGETAYDNSNETANNRRTLTLSNGEVIWDMSGNVWEWTSGQIAGNQPGLTTDTPSYYNWRQWNTSGLLQNGFPSSSMPSSMASGALSNINSWTTYNGIGILYSNYNETASHGFLRGGFWGYGVYSGVLCLILSLPPSAYYNFGFRVAYTLPSTSP